MGYCYHRNERAIFDFLSSGPKVEDTFCVEGRRFILTTFSEGRGPRHWEADATFRRYGGSEEEYDVRAYSDDTGREVAYDLLDNLGKWLNPEDYVEFLEHHIKVLEEKLAAASGGLEPEPEPAPAPGPDPEPAPEPAPEPPHVSVRVSPRAVIATSPEGRCVVTLTPLAGSDRDVALSVRAYRRRRSDADAHFQTGEWKSNTGALRTQGVGPLWAALRAVIAEVTAQRKRVIFDDPQNARQLRAFLRLSVFKGRLSVEPFMYDAPDGPSQMYRLVPVRFARR